MESIVGIKCFYDDDLYDFQLLLDFFYFKCLGMIVLVI